MNADPSFPILSAMKHSTAKKYLILLAARGTGNLNDRSYINLIVAML